MTKARAKAEGRRLVGAGIVGPHAGEPISEATLVIEMGADPEDVALSVPPPYPVGDGRLRGGAGRRHDHRPLRPPPQMTRFGAEEQSIDERGSRKTSE